VEPLLATCLLFAFGFSAYESTSRVRWQEWAGCLLLCAALAMFLYIADPQIDRNATASWQSVAVASGVIAASAWILVSAGQSVGNRRGSLALECALIAAAAGALYGLQDAMTRGAIVSVRNRAFLGLFGTYWPYILLAAATAAVLLSQSAFRVGRLDYALPPTAAIQPIAGVGLAVGLLGDRVEDSPAALAGQMICVAAMLAAVVLIGRSPALSGGHRLAKRAEKVPSSAVDS
jgi:hypothetical protein